MSREPDPRLVYARTAEGHDEAAAPGGGIGPGARRILELIDGQRCVGDLQDFAVRITSAGGICLVAASDSDSGRTSLLFAAASNPPLAMNELLKQTLTPVGGKGGGNAVSAQGGVQGGDAEKILAAARDLLQQKKQE